jgi:D-glycero-alpha-D-manno-heptose 1-phosphate guanylyltransferase
VTHTAVILAGGFGSRLREMVNDLPKPLAPVSGKPFLSYLLRYLHHHGFSNIVLSVGHLAEKISEFYGKEFMGMTLTYATEAHPLGTGGGIRLSLESCDENTVLVLNGDSFFDIDLIKFIAAAEKNSGCLSIALREVADTSRYGSIVVGENHTIKSFGEKSGGGKGLINGGIYLLDRSWFLAETHPSKNFSLEKDLLEKKAGSGILKGYAYEGYFIDIGLPTDYARAQDDFKRFKY